jgi:hypothetical protein
VSDHVVFEDYSVKCKDAIREKAISFLEEVGGELRSRTQRNSRRKTSKTAGSYEYKVDEGQLAVHVGSNYQNAIWEELGTGEHAIDKDGKPSGKGRKGWWVYVTGNVVKETSTDSKSYSSPEEAKRAVAILKEKGLDAHMTKGKTANRPLFKAYESFKSGIKRRAEEIFGGLNS